MLNHYYYTYPRTLSQRSADLVWLSTVCCVSTLAQYLIFSNFSSVFISTLFNWLLNPFYVCAKHPCFYSKRRIYTVQRYYTLIDTYVRKAGQCLSMWAFFMRFSHLQVHGNNYFLTYFDNVPFFRMNYAVEKHPYSYSSLPMPWKIHTGR